MSYFFFFFNDTATTEIYTLSLHDALPICRARIPDAAETHVDDVDVFADCEVQTRSEEHTSELQSRENLVCRLLLEKKKKKKNKQNPYTNIDSDIANQYLARHLID